MSKRTEGFPQDVSQRPLLLSVHVLVLHSPMFQQVWLVQSVAYSRVTMSHPRSGYGKDINFCLRCSGILFLTSSVGSCHVCGHSGSLWRGHLTRIELKTQLTTTQVSLEMDPLVHLNLEITVFLASVLAYPASSHERFCPDLPVKLFLYS